MFICPSNAWIVSKKYVFKKFKILCYSIFFKYSILKSILQYVAQF